MNSQQSKLEFVRTGPVSDNQATYFVPTNRFNLMQYQHMCQILPWAALSKPYIDFSRRAPDRIPVISQSSNQALTDILITEKTEVNIPVLLELNPDALVESQYEVMDNQLGFALNFPLRFELVEVAHFRTDKELRDYIDFAKGFGYPGIRTHVSPHLFEEGEIEADEFGGWLGNLEPLLLDPENYQKADAFTAAVMATTYGIDSGVGGLDWCARLLNLRKIKPIGVNVTARSEDPDWILSWSPNKREIFREGTDFNTRVFHAVCDILINPDSSKIDTSSILEQVTTNRRVKSHSDDQITEYLKQVQSVLNNDSDHAIGTDQNTIVLDALLIFLMRRDPERIMKWSLLNDLPAVRLTALFFAGLDVGRNSLGSDLCNEHLNRQFLSIYESIIDPKRKPVPVTVTNPNAQTTQIIDSEHRTLIEQITAQPSLSSLAAKIGQKSHAEQIASKICDEEKWLECLSISIDISAEQIAIEPRDSHRLAIKISGLNVMPKRTISVDVRMLILRLENVETSSETPSMTELRQLLED